MTTLPPVLPTLDLGSPTGFYDASGFTRFASSAIVTGDTTDKILGLQVRIDTGDGTLGVANGSTLQTSGTSGKITYSYISGTKLLRLTDTSSDLSATGADFQAVLQNVAISGASSNVSISANLGKPVYRSENGHYYEFVSVPSPVGTALPTWTASKTAAELSRFLGLQGYLASVTSAEENAFLTATFDSRGWIGAQADVNRKWTWVGAASPENGKSFWIGNVASSSTNADLTYSNWDPFDGGEPNNFGSGELYVQFTTGGRWNDLADAPIKSSDSRYNPDGYWIEYSEAASANNLAATRDTISLTANPQLDLIFYDEVKGQFSYGFTGNGFNIPSEGLTADTPVLTNNASSSTPQFGPNWRTVSANVDVDKDGVKDLIVANKIDNTVVVFFGENRTSTLRQYAYTRAAAVTFNGASIAPGTDWTLSFASNKIGTNDSPGLFWFNKSGISAIWTLKPVTNAGVTTVGLETSGVIFNAGENSGWKAIGDGEFNQNTATREVFWMNEKSSKVVTWSLNGASRTIASSGFAWDGLVSTSAFKVVGISSINGTVNDNIIWQTGSTIAVWNMKDSSYSAPGSTAFAITAADRIKAVADVDGDNVLDLIGQNDSNGTIASYALTAGFALKNTGPASRTQYASNNVAGYRPAKGGLNNSQLELVNVAQYDSPNVAS